MKNLGKVFLATIGLIVISAITRMLVFLLLYAGVRGGWGWFLGCFIELIFLLSFISVMFYLRLLDWAKNSCFAATFTAVLVSLFNILDILGLFAEKFQEKPVLASLCIVCDLLQIIFVIWACKEAFGDKHRKIQS